MHYEVDGDFCDNSQCTLFFLRPLTVDGIDIAPFLFAIHLYCCHMCGKRNILSAGWERRMQVATVGVGKTKTSTGIYSC